MKIAQVSMRFPPGPGGVERHVAEISGRLGARGHRVDVFTSELYREFPMQRLGPDVPREEARPFGNVHRLPVRSLPGPLHYPFFRGLESALSRQQPEVVHVHTYGTHQVAVAGRYGRATGTPFVLTAHFHPIWSIEGGWVRHRLRGFYDRRLAGPIVRAAARVIVQTREEERLLRSLGLELPPVHVIPPGYAPLAATAPGGTFRARYGITGPYLLFVGRLASNKGLLPLLEAFRTVAHDAPSATLVLIGEDGGMRTSVEAAAVRLGLGERVRILGHVPDDAVLADAYRDARLTVLPSEYEAFGLVLLESLAQGTPVVASRVGGIPEFVPDGQAGLLVTPNDPSELARAILRLWDDTSLAGRLGAYGREVVVPQYTWDRLVDRLEGVYRDVVGP
ncbi:MAG: glycosyltransferase family 4 protein [Thermoplasmata archaeon]|nr:glycosyltransferase family 4 protein [Thermoplasmata archaeon]